MLLFGNIPRDSQLFFVDPESHFVDAVAGLFSVVETDFLKDFKNNYETKSLLDKP